MLHVAQAICSNLSHFTETNLGGERPYWGSKSPILAPGLLLGAEELQSSHCIEMSPWTSRWVLEASGSAGRINDTREDNEPCGTVSD